MFAAELGVLSLAPFAQACDWLDFAMVTTSKNSQPLNFYKTLPFS